MSQRSPHHPSALVPLARSAHEALADSDILESLMRRMQHSRARYACIEVVLPVALCDHVQPAGVDDEHWTLLADSPAAAAKLRQLVPAFEHQLRARGFEARTIRIRVHLR
jgi:hypothetical protein